MYATCIDTCSTLIYINYIHIQVRGGGGGSGPPGPPPPASALALSGWPHGRTYNVRES